ncbi:hypothetical protein [Megamonas sp.]|uniref:hypothetical protein n=1 Tax=Megamonas sp. TaxID=2049033 RepID=UPI0025835522|nr:hypothetical protein [Megamonas sp.]
MPFKPVWKVTIYENRNQFASGYTEYFVRDYHSAKLLIEEQEKNNVQKIGFCEEMKRFYINDNQYEKEMGENE